MAMNNSCVTAQAVELGWSVDMTMLAFDTYGVRIGLRTNCENILHSVSDFLPPARKIIPAQLMDRVYSFLAAKNDGAGDFAHQLFADSELLAKSADWQELFERLESDLQIFVGEMAPQVVFLHAGVVAWQNCCIIIPGRSFTGKSALVTALLRAGASYYSDEFAVVDGEGLVHPYPRLLSLRIPDTNRVIRCTAESLGGQPASAPIRPALILLTRYRPGNHWSPRALKKGQAVLELMRHCLPARRKPGMALATLTKVLDHALVLQGARGEAEDTVQRLLRYAESLEPLHLSHAS